MKYLLSLILVLSSIQLASANYDCSAALSDDHAVDSKSFKINEFDVESDFEANPSSFAREAVKKLYENLDCEVSSNKDNSIVKCSEIVRGVSNSKVCYLQNDDGYFLISKDLMENINVLYNRWD